MLSISPIAAERRSGGVSVVGTGVGVRVSAVSVRSVVSGVDAISASLSDYLTLLIPNLSPQQRETDRRRKKPSLSLSKEGGWLEVGLE